MRRVDLQISDAFRNYSDHIRSFIYSKTGCFHTAEDLTQEAYIRLYRAKNMDEILDIRSYLYRVANNLIVDHYRTLHAKSAPTEMRDLSDERDLVTDDPSGEEVVDVREQIRNALQAVGELSALCQKIFWLSKAEGFRNYEIAEMESICLSTVEKNLSRATKKCALQAA